MQRNLCVTLTPFRSQTLTKMYVGIQFLPYAGSLAEVSDAAIKSLCCPVFTCPASPWGGLLAFSLVSHVASLHS